MTGTATTDSQLSAFRNAVAGRYLTDVEAGRGAMGVVYLARDTRLGRRVALKVLRPEVASDENVTAFRREISHALRLEHPNVLPILDVGEAEDLPFYVMRYVRGGSLRRRLQRDHRLSLWDAAGVVRQTGAALTHAHANRVLHCDVKPENILLDGDHVYLTDFGIARAVHADAAPWRRGTAKTGGTAGYVSPEQAFGGETLDQRVDLYGLASVVHEMLAGRMPFHGACDAEILARQFDSAVPIDELPRSVPLEVRVEIVRALSRAPADRHRSVSAFVAAFLAASFNPTRARRSVRQWSRDVLEWARRRIIHMAASITPRGSGRAVANHGAL